MNLILQMIEKVFIFSLSRAMTKHKREHQTIPIAVMANLVEIMKFQSQHAHLSRLWTKCRKMIHLQSLIPVQFTIKILNHNHDTYASFHRNVCQLIFQF